MSGLLRPACDRSPARPVAPHSHSHLDFRDIRTATRPSLDARANPHAVGAFPHPRAIASHTPDEPVLGSQHAPRFAVWKPIASDSILNAPHSVRAALAAVIGCLIALDSPLSRAAPPPRPSTGTIVRVDRDELFIDLGTDAGISAGLTIEVFRRVEIQHPVTKKVLVDRFSIGAATISEAGRLLSIDDDFASLQPPPRVGDLID